MPSVVNSKKAVRQLCPEGTYQAVCVGHFHLGTQPSKFGAKDQVLLTWAVNEIDDRGEPFRVSAFYTLSLFEKSGLAKILKSWLNFRPAEDQAFNTSELVGRQCLLTVAHKEKEGGGMREEVTGVAALPRGMPSINLPVDEIDYPQVDPAQPIPEAVPAWIAEKIMASKEWVKVHGAPPSKEDGNGNGDGHGNGSTGISSSSRERQTIAAGDVGPVPAGILSPGTLPVPQEVKPYLKILKLDWPYSTDDLAMALQRYEDTEEEKEGVRNLLEPHAIPF